MIDYLIEKITSYDYYNDRQVLFLDKNRKDWFVREKFTYSEWINNWKNSTNVLVTGLEEDQKVLEKSQKLLPEERINSIHMFHNVNGGYSFDEHKDETNVFLYVERGKKHVHMNGEIFTVSANEGIHIPKNVSHKVDSEADTWSLSIGYD